mmetsp:Transcript_9683/g.21619  ORF Transcript_9683/g.21619 Transcript_9683/m.21619 type:complete len:204 (-) Transcript_9683:1418-2029(-)
MPALEHSVHLSQQLVQNVLALRLHELVESPGEACSSCLVAGDKQSHQVVAELPGCDVLVPSLDQVLEHREVRVVLGEFLIRLLHCLPDQLVEHCIEEHQVLVVTLLIGKDLCGPREVPVRDHRLSSTLSLSENRVHRSDHWRLSLHRAKVVVKDGLADDIQGGRGEFFLHVHGGHVSGRCLDSVLELVAQIFRTLHHEVGGLR